MANKKKLLCSNKRKCGLKILGEGGGLQAAKGCIVAKKCLSDDDEKCRSNVSAAYYGWKMKWNGSCEHWTRFIGIATLILTHTHTHTVGHSHTLCGTADLTTNLNPQAGGEKIQTKTGAGIKTIAMNFYNRQTASRQMKSIESNAVNRATIEMENVINRTWSEVIEGIAGGGLSGSHATHATHWENCDANRLAAFVCDFLLLG